MSNIRPIPADDSAALVRWWEPFSRTTFPSLWERPGPAPEPVYEEISAAREGWRRSDLATLVAMWPSHTPEAIGARLHRSARAVRAKAGGLGLGKRRAAA